MIQKSVSKLDLKKKTKKKQPSVIFSGHSEQIDSLAGCFLMQARTLSQSDFTRRHCGGGGHTAWGLSQVLVIAVLIDEICPLLYKQETGISA